jgi:hypothetical protein
MKIKKFNESEEINCFEDIKIAFSNISDESSVKFYYASDIYGLGRDIFGYFDNYRMDRQVLVIISFINKLPDRTGNMSELENYSKYLESESRIYKSIYESLLKCEINSFTTKRTYQEILVFITLI